ncbi:MAG: hypothetical protein KDA93_01420 [Planctomycetaceae bacterium]|nr:hypothetical protein [Planctomycetaceae bacterium]
MSIRYFIAQYISDPFRKEPRNVGVIAFNDTAKGALFFAEQSPGKVDRKKALSRVKSTSVYEQWVDFWRGEMRAHTDEAIAALLENGHVNYEVIEGGEVTDYENDSIHTVVRSLYEMIVEGGDDLHGDSKPQSSHIAFQSSVKREFRDHEILLIGSRTPKVAYPVKEKAPVSGVATEHRPTFVQESRVNGLHVMETMDCSSHQNLWRLRERSGYAANMFEDIKLKQRDVESKSFMLANIDPEFEDEDDVKYAIDNMQHHADVIVNWQNQSQRDAFIAERVAMAGNVKA